MFRARGIGAAVIAIDDFNGITIDARAVNLLVDLYRLLELLAIARKGSGKRSNNADLDRFRIG